MKKIIKYEKENQSQRSRHPSNSSTILRRKSKHLPIVCGINKINPTKIWPKCLPYLTTMYIAIYYYWEYPVIYSIYTVIKIIIVIIDIYFVFKIWSHWEWHNQAIYSTLTVYYRGKNIYIVDKTT